MRVAIDLNKATVVSTCNDASSSAAEPTCNDTPSSNVSTNTTPSSPYQTAVSSSLNTYFSKLRGISNAPPRMPLGEALFSGLLTFIGMVILTSIHYSSQEARDIGILFNIGSFGATAVLVYAAPAAPFAQPRNVIVGHFVSAVIGVACRVIISDTNAPGAVFSAAALSVALSVSAMAAAGITHPPGGATALIAVVGGRTIGWFYVLNVTIAATILVVVALIGNNLNPKRRYPTYW
jgi:CBS-domain-containing membrane protein